MPSIKQSNKANKTTRKTKAPKGAKHFVEYVALGGHSDSFACTCGWKSNGYWDFPEAAWDEWLVHAFDTKTEIREIDKKSQARAVKERDDHEEFRKRFRR